MVLICYKLYLSLISMKWQGWNSIPLEMLYPNSEKTNQENTYSLGRNIILETNPVSVQKLIYTV